MSKSETVKEYEYNKVPVQELITEKEESLPKYGFGVRHTQLILLFFCLTVNVMGRGHMGVTVVAMTRDHKPLPAVVNTTVNVKRRNYTDTEVFNNNLTENKLIDVSIHNDKAIEVNIQKVVIDKRHQKFDWSKSIQEMVLSGFFLGYAIMMFPMGMVCQRYGGKLPLQIALLTNAIVSLVTPWFTYWGGWKAVCSCRILQGLSQAGTYPSVQAILAKWVPANERAMLTGYVYTGVTVGTVVAFQMGGLLAASPWGWPSTFYTVGVIFFICFILLTIFGSATPIEHKSISEEEKRYIMGPGHTGNAKRLKTPWKAIMTSKPIWGAMATHVGSNISFVFFFNQVPSYMHYILGVNVKNSGLLSSLPYVASSFTSLGYGWLSDYCTNNNIVSLTNARRISNSVAQCGIALCLILTSYTNNTIVAVSCLVVAMAIHMGVHTGWMVNHIDLAPNFCGTLMAIGNTLGTFFAVLTPIVVSNVVTDTGNVVQWRILFFIIASISVVCNFIFVLLVSTELQPWNNPDYNEKSIENPIDDTEGKK